MSTLTKPYELYVVKDTYVADASYNQSFTDNNFVMIGSDTMSTGCRAIDPKLTCKLNGDKSFTFTMYLKYMDTFTCALVDNPFVQYLLNETRLRLKYDGEWYDFVIKSTVKDNSKQSITYTCSGYFVQRLSKNGINVALNSDIGNNSGNVVQLGATILSDTDWIATGEIIPQTCEEALVAVKLNRAITNVQHINDPVNGCGITTNQIASFGDGNTVIYGFYSCHQMQTARFQWIYVNGNYTVNDKRVVTNADCQYYIDGVTYQAGSNDYKLPNVTFPNGATGTVQSVSAIYRGNKYTFKQKTRLNKVLDKYVGGYMDYQTYLEGYQDNNYISPLNLVNHISNNKNFKSTSGWSGAVRLGWPGVPDNGPEIGIHTYPYDLKTYLADNTSLPDDYHAYLKCDFTDDHHVLVNSCFENSDINDLQCLLNGQKLQLIVKTIATNGSSITPNFTAYVDHFDKENGYYSFTDIDLDNAKAKFIEFTAIGDGYYRATATIESDAKSLSQIYDAKYQLYLVPTFDESVGYQSANIVEIYLCEAIQDVSGNDLYPVIIGANNTLSRNYIRYWYYNPSLPANIAATSYKDYVWSYVSTYKNSNYTVAYNLAQQVRDIEVKDANYFSALQTLIETFQCWMDIKANRNEYGAPTAFYYDLQACDIANGPLDAYQYKYYEKNTSTGVYTLITSYLSSFDANKTYALYCKSGIYVRFNNHVGIDNYAGIKYGVNLKSVSRTYDSKSIISKLIVMSAQNNYAPNGICTITNADANETGESYIYDFTYYINQGLMTSADYESIKYALKNDGTWIARGDDLNDASLYPSGRPSPATVGWNCYGLYPRLVTLNKAITAANAKQIQLSSSITSLQAELVVYKSKKLAAEKIVKEQDDILKSTVDFRYNTLATLTGADLVKAKIMIGLLPESMQYPDIHKNSLAEDSYLQIVQALAAIKEQSDAMSACETALTNAQTSLATETTHITTYTNYKTQLTNCFQQLYSRFIQEGTWVDQNYVDANQYYLDAQKVMTNSSMPKVTYNIGLFDISAQEGYESFTFHLGDRTFVEDTEFFGYNSNGTPYHENVVITEITYDLNSPEKNSIKVQTGDNQFIDLFKSITATVQNVQYSAGSYNKAADLANADTDEKLDYLDDAVKSDELTLSSFGGRSITCDEKGIIVENTDAPDEAIRIVAGAIEMKKLDIATNITSWTPVVTAQGISADVMKSGTVDANNVTVKSGENDTFLWNNYGLTAFDWDTTTNKKNYTKWTRFNNMGVFGVTSKQDGRAYNPTMADINDLDVNKKRTGETEEAAMLRNAFTSFGLVHGRFWLNAAHTGGNYTLKTRIDEEGIRMYKIVGGAATKVFGVDDNGNAYFAGHIESSSGTIGGWTIAQSELSHSVNNYKDVILDTYIPTGSATPRYAVSILLPSLPISEISSEMGYLSGYAGISQVSQRPLYKFGICRNGAVYAQGLYAQSGILGGWNYDTAGLLAIREIGLSSIATTVGLLHATPVTTNTYNVLDLNTTTNKALFLTSLQYSWDDDNHYFSFGVDADGYTYISKAIVGTINIHRFTHLTLNTELTDGMIIPIATQPNGITTLNRRTSLSTLRGFVWANKVSVPTTIPTLAWEQTSLLATIDGYEIKVTMPANPGGGSGEPAVYIKNASVANEVLTLTKRDNSVETAITFSIANKMNKPTGLTNGLYGYRWYQNAGQWEAFTIPAATTVTAHNPTLSWGSTSNVVTVNGTVAQVTMPSKFNSVDSSFTIGSSSYNGMASLSLINDTSHSPYILLGRGSTSDAYTDYKIQNNGGNLTFSYYYNGTQRTGCILNTSSATAPYMDFTTTPTMVRMKKIQLPTSSGGSNYGTGSNGQVLMSNGTTVYWGTVSPVCLAKGTEIAMWDGSTKLIEDITVGDEVVGYDPITKQQIMTVVLDARLEGSTTDQLHEITFDDGSCLITAHGHDIYNIEEDRPLNIDKWSDGMKALTLEGTEVALFANMGEINTIDPVEYYNIDTDCATYYANGILCGCNEKVEVINLYKKYSTLRDASNLNGLLESARELYSKDAFRVANSAESKAYHRLVAESYKKGTQAISIINECKSQLAGLDYYDAKYAEGKLDEDKWNEVKAQKQALRDIINSKQTEADYWRAEEAKIREQYEVKLGCHNDTERYHKMFQLMQSNKEALRALCVVTPEEETTEEI